MYRILIAGDPTLCSQTEDALAKYNLSAQVDCMNRSGLEHALNSGRTLHWDLLIADFESFDTNDAGLLRSIKENNICFSSLAVDSELTPEKMKQAFLMNASDYLLKPLDSTIFPASIKRCLDAVDAMEKTNNISFVEQTLISAVTGGDKNTVHHKLPLYYSQICQRDCERMPDAENTLMKTAFHVYCAVMKQYPWIQKFIFDFGVFKEKTFFCRNSQDLYVEFDSYLSQIADAVQTLYLLSDHPMIQKVCLYILEHSDVKISLPTVAQHCFLNKTYLSHTFKLETGISFVDYITRVKMARAKVLILGSGLKIFEIASMLGFSDTGYFCKLFKKTQGITPNQYGAKRT